MWQGETVTVGPPFYNRWMAPIGIVIFALMGIAPLFGWRKTSEGALKQAFRGRPSRSSASAVLHFALGSRFGYPAMVPRDPFYPRPRRRDLAADRLAGAA